MSIKPLFDLTANLRALGGGRVWSLMTSLFGDLAQGKGDRIEGPVLSSIMALAGVKPEAARVALHRLRNDGWITSTKVGRISHHSLTVKGRLESAAASPRIYSEPEGGTSDWQLVMLESTDSTIQSAGFVRVQPRVYVGPKDAATPKGALVFVGQEAPEWLKREILPATLQDDYAKLYPILQLLSDALPNTNPLQPLEIAMLRCLVVHNWRRLVLKHPTLPLGLIDPNGTSHRCHTIVADLLARFPRPALSDIMREHATS